MGAVGDSGQITSWLALGGAAVACSAQLWSAIISVKPNTDSAVYQGFKGLVDGLQNRVNGLETKIDACEARHEDCEANLAKIRIELDEYMRRAKIAPYTEFKRPAVKPKKT